MGTAPLLISPYAEPKVPRSGECVRLNCTGDPMMYGRFMAWVWDLPIDLIVVEHDIIVSDAVLHSLASVGELACVPYLCYPSRTQLTNEVWSVYRVGSLGNCGRYPPGTPRAQRSGLGCVFIPWSEPARHHRLVDPPSWEIVDIWIGDHILAHNPSPTPWHCLWAPIIHEQPGPDDEPHMTHDPRFVRVVHGA